VGGESALLGVLFVADGATEFLLLRVRVMDLFVGGQVPLVVEAFVADVADERPVVRVALEVLVERPAVHVGPGADGAGVRAQALVGAAMARQVGRPGELAPAPLALGPLPGVPFQVQVQVGFPLEGLAAKVTRERSVLKANSHDTHTDVTPRLPKGRFSSS